jgi:hypothetical protein
VGILEVPSCLGKDLAEHGLTRCSRRAGRDDGHHRVVILPQTINVMDGKVQMVVQENCQ